MDELHGTLLWRAGVERHVACTFDEALMVAVAARPQLVLVERELPQSERLLRDLRRERSTRHVSIAVVVRGDVGPSEIELLDLGANAILRLPADPGWDERLARLINVAGRRRARLPVRIDFVASVGGAVQRITGSTANVSASGMLVECALPLDVGTDLDVRFGLPGSGDEIAGCGRVVRRDSKGRYGVHFYALEGEGEARIAAFVAAGARAGSRRR